ncbi:HAD family phosphatase [Paenibacillus hemerocallicola]|uniref:HAD family phosphatase n=1 Tax=Paenibacillus hemerocallicola TaxID=1172614 RepID=A0A5C4TCR1_9BACL|nr:Cof-type HAD-IIB family hydrolase [Paenibacillus hemerocallicola]TNJ66259.1 HAD family phosphatase [Paenibacillus hemerocallicola]
MTYKLLALDIDGTILNERGQLTAATKNSIRAVGEIGVKVVLCTGRSFHQCSWLIDELALTDPIITHNGAAAIHPGTRAILNAYTFDVGEMTPFIALCRNLDIRFYASTAFDVLTERFGEYESELSRTSDIPFSYTDDILKIEEPLLRFTLDDRLRVGGWQHIETTRKKVIRDHVMNVTHHGVNKGEALARLVRSFGIEREEVMAVGNLYNDLTMLEYAGLGVAMDNAPWQIKQRADAVTVSNREDGVHRAIHKYLLN